MTISARAGATALLTLLAVSAVSRLLEAETALGAMIKVVSAALAIGAAPGALLVLLWAPRRSMTALEAVGWGSAVSFGLVQALTIIAVTFHVPATFVVGALLVVSVCVGALVIRRGTPTIQIVLDELIVAALIGLLAATLYTLGSPIVSSEDQMHAAVVRRLAELSSPGIDNLYFVPGIVYTYPFPGTHYLMALVTSLANVDSLFVYHKLRFFWGPTAHVMLYLAARTIFTSGPVAAAVTVTAVAFVYAGLFAMVPGFSWGWGQLTPYSHASDVAMTVLLPALLVMGLEYLRSETARERAFFLIGASALILMLVAVHVREAVQFGVYIGCFLAATLAIRHLRPYARRAAVLASLVIAIAAMYAAWLGGTDALYGDVVAQRRADVSALTANVPLRDLLLRPASSVMADYLPEFEHVWDGVIPLFLFAGPLIVTLYHTRPLVWLMASSTAAYLAIMSVPLLALPYIYVTYYEILYTPVRNVAFFVYLTAGACLYTAALLMMQTDRTRLSLFAGGAVAGALALLFSITGNRSHEGFFLPLIVAYGLVFVSVNRPRNVAVAIASAAAGVAAFALLWPERAPEPRTEAVNIRWQAHVSAPERAALERTFSLGEGERVSDVDADVWSYRLADLSRDNVAAMVAHPAVADTHHIDRSSFVVERQPPRRDHLPLGIAYVGPLQFPTWALFVVGAAAAWMLAFVGPLVISWRFPSLPVTVEHAASLPFYRHAPAYALLLVPFTMWSVRPTLSPLSDAVVPPRSATTPGAMLAQLPCVATTSRIAPMTGDLVPGSTVTVPAETHCPPPATLIEWMRFRLPGDAVLAINLWNPYLPALFTSHQVVALPLIDTAISDLKQVFNPKYTPFYESRMREHQVQPFFNAVETPQQREEYVSGLGITHILVDPAHYDTLRPTLDALPSSFVLRYARERWAIYEAVRPAAPGSGV